MTVVNRYDIGDRVTITGTFTQNGAAVDPVTVRAKWRLDEGTVTTLTYPADISKLDIGIYSLSILTTTAGTVYYRMDDNGANVATEGQFVVDASNLGV